MPKTIPKTHFDFIRLFGEFDAMLAYREAVWAELYKLPLKAAETEKEGDDETKAEPTSELDDLTSVYATFTDWYTATASASTKQPTWTDWFKTLTNAQQRQVLSTFDAPEVELPPLDWMGGMPTNFWEAAYSAKEAGVFGRAPGEPRKFAAALTPPTPAGEEVEEKSAPPRSPLDIFKEANTATKADSNQARVLLPFFRFAAIHNQQELLETMLSEMPSHADLSSGYVSVDLSDAFKEPTLAHAIISGQTGVAFGLLKASDALRRAANRTLTNRHSVDLAGISNSATMLQLAINGKQPAIVRALIAYGADVNEEGLLARVVGRDDLNTAELLLKHDANPDIQNEHRRTPLEIAVKDKRNPAMVKLLLKYGATPETSMLDRQLHEETPNMSLIRPLLQAAKSRGIRIDEEGKHLQCLIYGALSHSTNDPDREAWAVALLRHGAKIPEETGERNLTQPALLRAIKTDRPSLACALIERGVDLGPIDRLYIDEKSYLAYAITAGMPDVVAALLGKGASSNSQNKDGQSMLEVAVRADQPAIAELLLQYGADPNAPIAKASSRRLFGFGPGTVAQLIAQSKSPAIQAMWSGYVATRLNQTRTQSWSHDRVEKLYHALQSCKPICAEGSLMYLRMALSLPESSPDPAKKSLFTRVKPITKQARAELIDFLLHFPWDRAKDMGLVDVSLLIFAIENTAIIPDERQQSAVERRLRAELRDISKDLKKDPPHAGAGAR